MKLCDYIACLIKKNESIVTGIPGYPIMPIWNSVSQIHDIILACHESGAAYIADGWSRITHKAAFVLTTVGPGQTNVFSGIASAYKDNIPLICITGQNNIDTYLKGPFQNSWDIDRGFSVTSVFKNITKYCAEITNIETAKDIIDYAVKISLTGRKGPVLLSIPMNIQMEEINNIKSKEKYNVTLKNDFHTHIRQTKEICVNSLINDSLRPLLLIGWGSYCSNAKDQIYELAKKLNAPIISTIKGKSIVPQDCCYWGHVGSGMSKTTQENLKRYNPDLMICLGASLSGYYMDLIDPFVKKSKLIQIDIDESQLGLFYPVDIGISDDVCSWIKNNLDYLYEKETKRNTKYNLVENIPDNYLMGRSIKYINDNFSSSIIVPDAGNHWLETLFLCTNVSNELFTNSGLGIMGHAIGSSIGMSLALKNSKKIICITGDGSFLMNGNEIISAQKYNCNMIFIIYNNSSLGRVRTFQVQHNQMTCSSNIANVNFQMLCNSFNVKSYRVRSLEEFKQAFNYEFNKIRLSVIEVIVSKEEMPLCML